MSYFDTFINNVERGKQGLNTGLPHGFDRLNDYIPNIQQATYYSIGGEQGSGKTSLCDSMFLYNPIEWYLENKNNTDIKLDIIYWSMEISLENKLTKYAAIKIFKKFGIVTDINLILSRGRNRIDDTLFDYCYQLKNDFDKFEDIVKIYDQPINPTGVHKYLEKYYADRGKYEKVDDYNRKYIPNDPNLYTISITDHAGITKKEAGADTDKAKIDKLSEYYRYHRNTHKLIPVMVNQFNRSLGSADRAMKAGGGNKIQIRPQATDWKDTGCVGEDANVMMGIFSPARYELSEFDGYQTGRLGDRFRAANVVKNRDGAPNISVGLAYIGEVGFFEELPKSSEIKEDTYRKLEKIKKYESDGKARKERELFD